ncbi:hypothetical protein AB0C59_14795 [Streptomyces sp. NPDC048664]|uniref:hypothetical protein n=1 Tax=Streptomyces sp. NPDC048664 TaxID=3154505 RepID=UPI0034167F64
MPIVLLLTTAATAGVGVAVLCGMRSLRRQVAALHGELARSRGAQPHGLVPAARSASDTEEIRAAVADALAEERERELAEARAFWAAQEAHDIADAPTLLGLPDSDLFLPRPSDFAGLEHDDLGEHDGLGHPALGHDDFGQYGLEHGRPEQVGLEHGGLEPVGEPVSEESGFVAGAFQDGAFAGESPERAAARRRHPSHPDFVPSPSPVVGNPEGTVSRLEKLAAARTELADVRPGPLGTLDVYVFADGTTLCMTPGHRETAQRLASALAEGNTPVLLGGSGVSGAYALTFGCGEENVYVLADRVIASM